MSFPAETQRPSEMMRWAGRKKLGEVGAGEVRSRESRCRRTKHGLMTTNELIEDHHRSIDAKDKRPRHLQDRKT